MTTRRKKSTAALVAAVSLATAGCSTSGLASLPLPHPGLGKGGYNLNAVQQRAQPARLREGTSGRCRRRSDGLLEARDYTAVAKLRIRDGVQLPKGTTVELRSATCLGDVFIAVKPRPMRRPTHRC